MNSDWKPAKLGDFSDILTGFPFKSAQYADHNGVRLLRGANVAQGMLRWSDAKLWPEDDTEKHDTYALAEGDVILAMDRPWIDAGLKLATVRDVDLPCLLVQRVARLRGRRGVSTRFIRYVTASQSFSDYLVSVQTGTAVPHISKKQIENFEFVLPPPPERIAAEETLESIDHLADALSAQITTAENIIRTLFQSWFVDFLPVRAKAAGATSFRGIPQDAFNALPDSFEDSEIGEVPRGWDVERVERLIDFNPKLSVKKGAEADYLGMADLPTDGPIHAETSRKAFTSGAKFENGDTLLARITPCLENGKTAFAFGLNGVAFGSTEFIVMRPADDVPNAFPYALARNTEFRDHAIRNMTGTSGRQRVSSEALQSYEIAEPSVEALTAFADATDPMLTLIVNAAHQMRTLAALRDTLLPRLMSGELTAPPLPSDG